VCLEVTVREQGVVLAVNLSGDQLPSLGPHEPKRNVGIPRGE